MDDLSTLITHIRQAPGLREKLELDAVAEILGGEGDDAGLLTVVGDWAGALAAHVVPAPDLAMVPTAAAYRGVVMALNNLAATGSRAMALVVTLGGDADRIRPALEGVRDAAIAYDVPILGGDSRMAGDLALAVVAVGWTSRPLASANVRPGDHLVMVTCDDVGVERHDDGRIILDHLVGARREHAVADLALIPSLAEVGAAWAGRDISRAGVIGSAIQMLESAGSYGAAIDVDALPVPDAVTLDDYVTAAQTFGFILAGDVDRIRAEGDAVGLRVACIGEVDASSVVRLRRGETEVPVWDLRRERLTGMRAADLS